MLKVFCDKCCKWYDDMCPWHYLDKYLEQEEPDDTYEELCGKLEKANENFLGAKMHKPDLNRVYEALDIDTTFCPRCNSKKVKDCSCEICGW